MMQGPHVVEAIRELDQDDADIVHHRQRDLAEVLRLAFFPRRELDRPQFGHALDDMRDVDTEEFLDTLDRGLRVLDDVVKEARGDRDDVEPMSASRSATSSGWTR